MEATMRASSDTIAQLAAAMAKAQSELVNPPKSLTAVLERGNGTSVQTYRYAPLSSGLDIVRKSFGKYELALIQTTHVDRERSFVLLTTTIAHGSGEWISGLWPVCSLADLGHPKLMGAALTYARRYCLFTMAGLAGEDDLDAPDLQTAKPLDDIANGPDPGPQLRANADTALQSASSTPKLGAIAEGTSPGQELEPSRRRRRGARRIPPSSSSSASSGDPGGDLAQITDADALLRWALENLPARNKLGEHQLAALDAAFLARADAIGADPELLTPFALHRAPSPLGDGRALPSI
jgi:hypothetical protein